MTFDQKKYDELFETARALAITHNLLTAGIYQGSGYKDLSIAIPFIQSMHEQVMKDLEPLMAEKEKMDDVAALEKAAFEAAVDQVGSEVVSE